MKIRSKNHASTRLRYSATYPNSSYNSATEGENVGTPATIHS